MYTALPRLLTDGKIERAELHHANEAGGYFLFLLQSQRLFSVQIINASSSICVAYWNLRVSSLWRLSTQNSVTSCRLDFVVRLYYCLGPTETGSLTEESVSRFCR